MVSKVTMTMQLMYFTVISLCYLCNKLNIKFIMQYNMSFNTY
jgi:hypothetical protein